jgi:glycosyltransferase involved in cell wall biosynthesis
MSLDPHATQRGGQGDAQSSGAPVLEISVVLPCLNEVATIAACVTRAQQGIAALGVSGEVIVVDNNSDDNSADLARAAGARIITASRRGYGSALRTGIAAATSRYVIIADSDATYTLDDLAAFWDRLERGDDLVIGNRFTGGIGDQAMPYWHRRVGNPLLSAIGRAMFAVPLGDFHCGIRAFDRDAITALNLSSDGMEFATEMIAKAAMNGLVISEVPTTLARANAGRRSHLRPVRDAARHLALMTSLRLGVRAATPRMTAPQ